MASYWTMKRKAKAIVRRQFEAIDCVEEEKLSDGDVGEEMELMAADMNTHDLEDRAESDTDSDSSDGGAADLGQELTRWAVEENIPHSSLGRLLKILKCHHPSLPADPRTLLKTEIGGHEHQEQGWWDILPLWYPGINDGDPGGPSKPFVITLFSGNSKPELHEYMEDFVQDMNSMERGFQFKGMNLQLKLQAMVCDAPARAFLKCVKGHAGYSGCEKCTQEGEYMKHRVVFPDTNAPLRRDEDFTEKMDEGHHLGTSPLLATSLGLVSGFPLDFMHLVCLGVMRRLVYLWLKGPLACRLSSRQVYSLSDDLESARTFTPMEFNRRPRALKEVDRWKASEFRQLLLYTGPVLFKAVLNSAVYQHFLLLFVAIFILSNDKLVAAHLDYANSALNVFVRHFRVMYGDMYVSYNVHNLVHLANDVKLHGNLNTFSAFKFENFLKTLKKMVRKPQAPCSQVVKRILEGASTPLPKGDLGLKGEHLNGPLPPMTTDAVQYSAYKTDSFTLKLDRANSYVCIDGKVGRIRIKTQEDIWAIPAKILISLPIIIILIISCPSAPPQKKNYSQIHNSSSSSSSSSSSHECSSPAVPTTAKGEPSPNSISSSPAAPTTAAKSYRSPNSMHRYAVEKFLMEQVGELQVKVDHIICLLQSKHTHTGTEFISLPMLPLGSVADLDSFDAKLQADSNFRNKVIDKLSLSGGKNIKETVWRVCAKLFQQQLATKLNWCGRGQKMDLKARPIHHVILGAVLANPAAPSTEAEAEAAIKNWLRLSGDRNGGRQRRNL
ncbi:hypothetical protein ACEWY4_001481 [Coilia grayii]|uniref:DUF4806 domain-containing protein n=1 Tax=Coilia grayii TaxID=363190 RepID=A0ABD1KT13_9TELE